MADRVLFVGAPALGAPRRALPLKAARPRRPPRCARPRMMARDTRVGVPAGGRTDAAEAIATEAAAPHPAAQWVRAHPLQTASLAALILPVLVRWVLRPRAAPSAAGVRGGGGARGGAAAPAAKTAAATATKSTLSRAVPRRHETTEEAMDLLGNTARKYVIVGGKGGVGKTSMSASVATQFADRGQTTLIVSTDPAHSLSDAFGQSVSGGDPVPVLGIDNLYAQEVNPESVKRTFKMMSQQQGAGGAGALAGMEDMGLDDLNSLFETLPPGFDEAVALVEIVKYIEGDPAYKRFDRIVFDTAPTGHTLRLLSLPDFLNGFFGKIISMKSKFGNVMNQFKGMFGGNDMADMNASMDDMEELKRSMAVVRDLFRDEIQTEFIVATIPNMMAISESSRLVEELRKERIPVRHLFVNQVQPSNDGCTFCSARHKEQVSNMEYIARTFKGLQISTVQSFDREIKGAGALRTMGAQLFPGSGNSGSSPAAAAKAKDRPSATTPPSEPATPKATAELVD